MRVSINYDRCEGHAICVGLAPGVFQIDEDDEQVTVVNDTPDSSEREHVATAARRCPIGAITASD